MKRPGVDIPKNLIATASTRIAAPAGKVWDALVNPEPARAHSARNWKTVLDGLKKLVDK